MTRTESQLLATLECHGPSGLTPYELYRAHVPLANNGTKRESEESLLPEHRALLEARRLIHAREHSSAHQLLSGLEVKESLLAGDRSSLLGAIAHREGNVELAARHYAEAGQHFEQGGDAHRMLRARINSRICENDLQSYLAGPLFALEQEARRREFRDLAAIVQKARAGELLSRGRFAEAFREAQVAIESFCVDGCSEDLEVARLLAALAAVATGDLAAGKQYFESVHLSGGKLVVYQDAYRALLAGKLPSVPPGHPLEGTPWPSFAVKSESIPGKVLRRLQQGPATRTELIEAVWGKDATHPSYQNRLFNVLNKLKKTFHQTIIFDGSAYRLK